MQMTKKYKIFEIDYLQNAEFTEEDLVWLFETSSFYLSLIVEMFNSYDDGNLPIEKIAYIVKTDDKWMYKHYWSDTQREEFEEKAEKCFKNLYRYGDEKTKSILGMWIANYGFTNESQRKNKMMLLSD